MKSAMLPLPYLATVLLLSACSDPPPSQYGTWVMAAPAYQSFVPSRPDAYPLPQVRYKSDRNFSAPQAPELDPPSPVQSVLEQPPPAQHDSPLSIIPSAHAEPAPVRPATAPHKEIPRLDNLPTVPVTSTPADMSDCVGWWRICQFLP